MGNFKKIIDKIQKGKQLWDEHGSKIVSHGKDIFEKGKKFAESKEGQSIIGFAKQKFSKKSQNNENKDDAVNANVSFADVLELGNKAKEIYENDVSQIAAGVQGIKSSWNNESFEIETDNLNNTEECIEKEKIVLKDKSDANANDVVDVTAEIIPEKKDTFFEDNLNTLYDASMNAVRNIKNPEEVLKALNTLQVVANDTIKYAEMQETKRVEINAQKEVAIEKIKTIGDAIKTYLEKTFDERSSIFAKQFEVVDAALKNGNLEMLAMSLNSINNLAAQSPFKALADMASVQKNLLETNTEWDI